MIPGTSAAVLLAPDGPKDVTAVRRQDAVSYPPRGMSREEAALCRRRVDQVRRNGFGRPATVVSLSTAAPPRSFKAARRLPRTEDPEWQALGPDIKGAQTNIIERF
jgi:hypothetical protein